MYYHDLLNFVSTTGSHCTAYSIKEAFCCTCTDQTSTKHMLIGYWNVLLNQNLDFNYTEIPYWTHSCTNVYLERGRRWIASRAAGAECVLVVDTRQHLMPKTFKQTHTQSRLWWQKPFPDTQSAKSSESFWPQNQQSHTALQGSCHFKHLEMSTERERQIVWTLKMFT